jgi:hypothetical protein
LGTGVWPQGFALARQALYCLSHSFSPFCSDYFADSVLLLCLRLPGLWSSYFRFLP